MLPPKTEAPIGMAPEGRNIAGLSTSYPDWPLGKRRDLSPLVGSARTGMMRSQSLRWQNRVILKHTYNTHSVISFL
jgi:hypothetical protein